MQIESAQYIADETDTDVSIEIKHDSGQVCNCPIGGSTWINSELDRWIASGNSIVAASPP